MSQLTTENIEYIHRKLKSRGVAHIDLRYELADHIATGIEEKMELGTTFQNAFDEVMDTFGRCGISKLQQEKSKKLLKQSKIIVWEYIKSYFKLPKIIMTLLIILIFTAIYCRTENCELYFACFWGCYIAVLIFISVFLLIKYHKKRFSQLEPFAYIMGFIGIIPIQIFNAFNAFHLFNFNSFTCIALSSVFTLMMVVAFEMYLDIRKELTKQYGFLLTV